MVLIQKPTNLVQDLSVLGNVSFPSGSTGCTSRKSNCCTQNNIIRPRKSPSLRGVKTVQKLYFSHGEKALFKVAKLQIDLTGSII